MPPNIHPLRICPPHLRSIHPLSPSGKSWPQQRPYTSPSTFPPFVSKFPGRPSKPESAAPSHPQNSTPPSPTRHALITGGTRGIGLAIAKTLSANNIRCTLLARTPSPTAVASLENQHLNHGMLTGDVSDVHFWNIDFKSHMDSMHPSAPIASSGQQEHQDPHKIDILVNSAGLSQTSLLVRTDTQDLSKILDTNLLGTMLATRALLKNKSMRWSSKDPNATAWKPVIINLTSLLAQRGGRGAVAYSTSKAGVIGLTHALAEELGPSGIRVNAIVPGYIETDMTKTLPKERYTQLIKKIPMGRFGSADEVADAASFLVKNQYASNCVINLDGGLSAISG